MAAVKAEEATQPTEIIIHKPKTIDGTKNLFVWFRLLGIVMPKRFKVLYMVYFICLHFLTFVITPMSFSLSYFFSSEEFDILNFFSSLQFCFQIHASAAKFFVLILHRKQVFRIEGIFDELDARIKYKSEIQRARKAIRLANATIIIFQICYSSYTATMFVGSLFNGRPPYSLYNPFINWHDSKWHFIAVCIIEFFMVNVQVFQNVCNDSYSLTYLIIIHCHLKLLIMRVQKIGTDTTCTREDNKKELIQSINDHKKIIELCDILIEVMSVTYFFIFLTATMALGSTLITLVSEDNCNILGSAMHIIAIILEIVPICYLVTCLTDEFNHLSQAIFSNNWIDQSQEFRKLSLFFMHRAQLTPVFDAGKFFTISLDTFVSIVKFSFSLYTLLSNMDFGIN